MIENRLEIYLPHIIENENANDDLKKSYLYALHGQMILTWNGKKYTEQMNRTKTQLLRCWWKFFFMLLARIFNSPLFCEQSRMEQINLQFHL